MVADLTIRPEYVTSSPPPTKLIPKTVTALEVWRRNLLSPEYETKTEPVLPSQTTLADCPFGLSVAPLSEEQEEIETPTVGKAFALLRIEVGPIAETA